MLAYILAAAMSLSSGWRFALDGEVPRMVNIPHDWSIEFAPSSEMPSGCAGGFYRTGKATYEREIDGGEFGGILEFEAVYRDAKVYVDGKVANSNYYGYTGFEVKIPAGKHQIKVVVDNSDQPNCRWYSGSGIIRPVTLRLFDRMSKTERKQSAARTMPKIEWSAKGLKIDGKIIKLNGACVHHDHGPLGAAAYPEAELRKVRQLKAAGFNAVRCSHNPASEAFLDACDQEGLWVVQEFCDDWNVKKTAGSYGNNFARDWMKDLTWMVKRDKHHPSIIAWSIGNEIYERTSESAVHQAAAMSAVIKTIDPTRPVTQALCCWGDHERRPQDALASKLDIVGYNYMEKFLAEDHRLYPEMPIWLTESYPREVVKNYHRIHDLDYVFGEFVWTGIDYLGEAGIGCNYYNMPTKANEHYQLNNRTWPNHGAYCGDIDLTGWRKPVSHLRETLWSANAPTYIATEEPDGWKGKIFTTGWSVWPAWESWNYEGWENKPITVVVMSRKPQISLYLNGRLIETRPNGAANDWHHKFQVPYEPGELKAVAGDEVAILKTAGKFDHWRFTDETIGSMVWRVATACDCNGVPCPNYDGEIEFEGEPIATCSGDVADPLVATSPRRKAYHGRAMAIYRSTVL